MIALEHLCFIQVNQYNCISIENNKLLANNVDLEKEWEKIRAYMELNVQPIKNFKEVWIPGFFLKTPMKQSLDLKGETFDERPILKVRINC